MAEYLPVYSDRGRLSYIPDHHLYTERLPPGFFQGRNRRPHRIHITHVAPDRSLFLNRSSSRSYIIEKLAGPRDNAKKFLRSLIDTHFSSVDRQVDRTPSRASSSIGSCPVPSSPESRRRSWAENMRTSPRHSMVGAVAAISRPALVEAHRVSSGRHAVKPTLNTSVSVVPEQKPLASANGINLGISLAEPVLFLQGFEPSETSERSTAMLRGHLHLKVTKPSKIKAITLKFRGKATTKWPEGILP